MDNTVLKHVRKRYTWDNSVCLYEAEKAAQDRSKNPSDAAFASLVSAVSFLRMAISKRYNAKWDIEDAVRMLVAMAESSMCANQTAEKFAGPTRKSKAKKIAVPSPAWLLGMLGKIEFLEMMERCNAMLRCTAEEAAEYAAAMFQKSGMPAVIAMDETEIPRYDKNKDPRYLKHSKGKKGTTYFEAYLTCKIMLKRMAAAHVGCTSVVQGDKLADLVRKMLEKCVDLGISSMLGSKRGTVLLDRGFYSVDVMSVIDDAGFAFIMPAVKNRVIKNAIKEHANEKRPAVSRHTMKSAEGKEFAFRLIINKNPRKINSDNITDRYYVFATTRKCKSYDELLEYVPREYRKRWDIETGYQCVKSIRLKTTSLNPSTRHALFCISLVIANIWVVIRNSFKTKTRRIMLKEMLAYAFSDAYGKVQQDAVADKPKSGLKREPG